MNKSRNIVFIVSALVFVAAAILLIVNIFNYGDDTVSTSTSSDLSLSEQLSSQVSLYKMEHFLDTEYNTAIAAAKSDEEKAEITKTYAKKWTNKRLSNYNYLHKYYLDKGNNTKADEIVVEHETLKKQLTKQINIRATHIKSSAADYDYRIAKISYDLERKLAINYYEKCLALSIKPESL